jgi:hypothetical protein
MCVCMYVLIRARELIEGLTRTVDFFFSLLTAFSSVYYDYASYLYLVSCILVFIVIII